MWLDKNVAKIKLMIEKAYTIGKTNHIVETRNIESVAKAAISMPRWRALWDLGIILRDQNKTLNLQDCIRITVGTKEECERVVEAIKQIN